MGDSVSACSGEILSLAIEGAESAALAAEPDNLVLRAARALATEAGLEGQALLHLLKRLPVASGIGGGSADAAASLAVLAQDAPDKLRQEWQLFLEEVEQEAERLEQPEAEVASTSTRPWPEPAAADPQEQIDDLRAQVARVARRLEDRS